MQATGAATTNQNPNKMAPIESAMLVYATEPCYRTFQEDLTLHLLHGYVISTPEVFIMGRPVNKDAEHRLITDPTVWFYDPDCWLVHLAAGDINQFFRHEPYQLEWFGWQRANKLRFYNRRNVARMLGHSRPVRAEHACRCTGQFRPAGQGAEYAQAASTAKTDIAHYGSGEFAEAQSNGQAVSESRIFQYDPDQRTWHAGRCPVASEIFTG
jgi:hypothetical protein